MRTNKTRAKSSASLVFGAILFVVSGSVGCGSLKLPASLDGFSPVSQSQVDAEAAEKQTSSKGTYELMMKPRYGKGAKATQPIKGTVLLQDVIELSREIKKFRSMEITIYRPVKGSPVPLQMQCEYDSSSGSVSDAENYEIYPGDQILLEEVSGSKVGKLIGDLAPLDR
jgi:hypothetical protein